jgi:hypothetical protein
MAEPGLGTWWDKTGNENFLGNIFRWFNNMFVDPGKQLTENVTDLQGSDLYKALTKQDIQQLNPYTADVYKQLQGIFSSAGAGAQSALGGLGNMNTDFSRWNRYGQQGLGALERAYSGMDLSGGQNAAQKSAQAAAAFDPSAYVKQFLSLQPELQGLLNTDTSRQWAASDAAAARGASQAAAKMSTLGGLNSGAAQLAAQRAGQEISYNTASDIANRNAALQQQLYGNVLGGLQSGGLGRLSAQQQGYGQMADAIAQANASRLSGGQALAGAGFNMGQLGMGGQQAQNQAILDAVKSQLGYYGGLQNSALGGLSTYGDPIFSSNGSLLSNLTGAAGGMAGAGAGIAQILKFLMGG